MNRDFYKILGVQRNADDATIMKAFKKLAIENHPDRNRHRLDEATKIMQEVNEAKNVLSDPEKRKIYDQYGEEGLKQSGQQEQQSASMQDIFSQIFGMHQQQETNNIPDVELEVDVPLEKLYTGTTMKKQIQRGSLCTHCHGTGSDDGIEHKCKKCNGQGMTVRIIRQGMMVQQIQEPCKSCKGIGVDGQHSKCSKCGGKCGITETYDLEFSVPAGAYSGLTMVVNNQGNEIPLDERKNAQNRTNIKILIKSNSHSEFKRMFIIEGKKNTANPADLLYELSISLAESLCGLRKNIKHLDGKNIEIHYDNCINHGDVLVIPKQGMPILNSNEKGDLYISFKIYCPTELDKQTKNKIWNLLSKTPYEIHDKKKKDSIEVVTLDQLNSDKKYSKSEEYNKHNKGNRQQNSSNFDPFGGMQNGNFFKMFFRQ
jgi:DnaJ-class molecular chaperone